MLKKLLSIGMLASLMAVATTSVAQNQAEYPRYGFWSNWSIGAAVDGTHQGFHGWKWAEGLNMGASIMFEKELNYVWDLRLAVNCPGIIKSADDAENKFDRYGDIMIDFKFSINDAVLGYNPERKGSIYLLAGAGLGLSRNQPVSDTTYTWDEDWRTTIVAEAGLGFSYKVCKHSTLFLEVVASDHGLLPNFFKSRKMMDGVVRLGYLYNFGPTAADVEMIAQRALLTQENLDALNNQITGLEQDLAASKQNEQRLKNRVNELENELANAPKANNKDQEVARLQNVIDQIKADQITYYALPFSIQFAVDEYQVADEEMRKIDAIARVMKDNPDVKFNVYGFCDYTGSDAYNQKLSEKRANAVKKLLVKKGVAEDRLNCEGKGKIVYFGDAKYEINRRVSFYRVIE